MPITIAEHSPPGPDATPSCAAAPFHWYEVVVRAGGVEVAWSLVAGGATEATTALLRRLWGEADAAAHAALQRVTDRGPVARCAAHDEQLLWTVPGPDAAQPAPFRVARCRLCLPADPRLAQALPLHPDAPPPPGEALPCPFCACGPHADARCAACSCGAYSATLAAAMFAEDARGRALTAAAGSERVGP